MFKLLLILVTTFLTHTSFSSNFSHLKNEIQDVQRKMDQLKNASQNKIEDELKNISNHYRNLSFSDLDKENIDSHFLKHHCAVDLKYNHSESKMCSQTREFFVIKKENFVKNVTKYLNKNKIQNIENNLQYFEKVMRDNMILPHDNTMFLNFYSIFINTNQKDCEPEKISSTDEGDRFERLLTEKSPSLSNKAITHRFCIDRSEESLMCNTFVTNKEESVYSSQLYHSQLFNDQRNSCHVNDPSFESLSASNSYQESENRYYDQLTNSANEFENYLVVAETDNYYVSYFVDQKCIQGSNSKKKTSIQSTLYWINSIRSIRCTDSDSKNAVLREIND